MLSIGEFSKICLVTTKTLRYYDEIGLVNPVHINNDSGYRYYDISQLNTMILINRLKGYELSLEDISEIISDKTNEIMLSKILTKQKELLAKKENYDLLLSKIESDIISLSKGENIMSYLDKLAVKLVERPTINVLFQKQTMAMADFDKYLGKLCRRVFEEKLTVQGGPIAIYYDEDFDPNKCTIELAIPIKEVVTGTRDLVGGLCANVTHKGRYSDLPSSYAKLASWIEKEGYVLTAPPYEIYLTDPKDTKPDDHITEIYFPVKKK